MNPTDSDQGGNTGGPGLIRLDQFLKMNFVTETGGQAKLLIQDGEVLVNGVIEKRRRHKLAAGDIVEANGETLVVPEAETENPE